MATQQHPRTTRVEARIAPDALSVVRRAAELQGRSVSDFVVTAALKDAQRTIEEAQIIRLSLEDQQRFVELLLNPQPLAPAMERALEARKSLLEECPQGRAAPSPSPEGIEETWGGPAFPQERPQGRAAPSPPPEGIEETWDGPALPQEAK